MKLIYFDAGNPQKKELEGLAKTAGYDFVPVAAMQTGQKIGYLAGVFRISGNAFARSCPSAANWRGYAFVRTDDGGYDRPGAGAVKKEPDFDSTQGDRYAL